MMEAIYKHASKEAPRECCGLVVQDGNNENIFHLKIFPLIKMSLKWTEKLSFSIN